MWVVSGVNGVGGIVVGGHVLSVVEIVAAVVAVVEMFGVAPGEWWTFRRKRGTSDPKGGIHRMRVVGGIH